MKEPYQIVDLFAGPGGLAEGFSSVVRGANRAYNIALSVEMEPAAHRTLTLRSFTRQFPWRKLPRAYYRFVAGEISLEDLKRKFPAEWHAATDEALRLELGTGAATAQILPRIDRIRERSGGKTVLIGGPPCQAYSLAGRSRNAGITGYVPEDDGRHFLYRDYIRILNRLRPAAFVMENVKGILSSSVGGNLIFQRILDDLHRAGRVDGGYTLLAMTPSGCGTIDSFKTPCARDFIVRAERHGIPQARHRVFVIGLRADIASGRDAIANLSLLTHREAVSVRAALQGMPRLRSGLSKGDGQAEWRKTVDGALGELFRLATSWGAPADLKETANSLRDTREVLSHSSESLLRSSQTYTTDRLSDGLPKELCDFIVDPRLTALAHHDSRGHMPRDIARYLFCSIFADVHSRTPKTSDFPAALAPNHQSWATGTFADRFKVQTWDSPSTTITSHISKDGHYYIHPDPSQCRSLTVREAARLQTFPDNYIFLGNRTQQYVQVGNAVPPFLAKQVADALAKILP